MHSSQYLVKEKTRKDSKGKTLVYTEVVQLKKFIGDKVVLVHSLASNSIESFRLEAVRLFDKEMADLFESNFDAPKLEELNPSSTFNLGMSENEKEAKNKLIMPYLKAKQPKVQIDMEEFNELYEEDVDADLDI